MCMLTFSSALSCLEMDEKKFNGIPIGFFSLWQMSLGIFAGYDDLHDEPIVLGGCFLYLVIGILFLLNMLVAQLTCAYDSVYIDMVGYARLKRIRIIVDSMPQVSPKRWERFVGGLNFDQRIEFNEGDIGLANGLATIEPASVNPTTVDMIKRFGGSTATSNPWPEDDEEGDDTDKFDRLETLIKRTMERITKGAGGGGGGKKHRSGAGSSAQESQGDSFTEDPSASAADAPSGDHEEE